MDITLDLFIVINIVDLGRFWLGITETEVTDKFARMHDEANVSYYNWASGQPNNFGGDQECVMVERRSLWAWNDRICTENKFIVCEMPN